MALFHVDTDLIEVQAGQLGKSEIEEAVKEYLTNIACARIPAEILIHHMVFLRFVSGQQPEFQIRRKDSLTGDNINSMLEDNWFLYHGKNRPLVGKIETIIIPSPPSSLSSSDSSEISIHSSLDSLSVEEVNRSFSDKNIEDFIRECAKIGKDKIVSSRLLYTRYSIWCRTNRIVQESLDDFRRLIIRQGYTPINQHAWLGMGLS